MTVADTTGSRFTGLAERELSTDSLGELQHQDSGSHAEALKGETSLSSGGMRGVTCLKRFRVETGMRINLNKGSVKDNGKKEVIRTKALKLRVVVHAFSPSTPWKGRQISESEASLVYNSRTNRATRRNSVWKSLPPPP